MAFHGFQSFAPGECTPEAAHEIGVKLAEEVWGKRFQVLVATHLDKTNHLHNHFVVNSVSYVDGLRYHRTRKDYRELREVSDRLCREYKLSVVEKAVPGRSKHYGEWKAEQEERPTYRGMVKADLEEAIANARTESQFFHYLKEKGYTFKFGQDITLCPAGRSRGLKIARNFGEGYTREAIRKRILSRTREKLQVREDSAPRRSKEGTASCGKPNKDSRGRRTFRPTRRNSGLRGLYVRYCYLLGILPKNRPPVSPKQMHVLLREDLAKLDMISKEAGLLCQYQIDTKEQLFSFKGRLQGQMKELIDTREQLRCRSRSIREPEKREEIKGEIADLSGQIRKLRKEAALCDGIAVRSGVMKEKLEVLCQEDRERKEETGREHIGRSR